MSQRKRPAPPQNRPIRNTTTASDSSRVHRAEDGYAAPSSEDRREAALLAELSELGYTVSVRCTRCNHPVCDPASVARHMGPKCAAKAVDHE